MPIILKKLVNLVKSVTLCEVFIYLRIKQVMIQHLFHILIRINMFPREFRYDIMMLHLIQRRLDRRLNENTGHVLEGNIQIN